MSQLDWKFLKHLPSITPVYGSILQAGDTALTMLSKLQGLLYKDLGASRSSVFNGTANSTADQDVLSLTIPADRITAGDVYKIMAYGIESHNNNNPTLECYIKINGTKLVTVSNPLITNGSNLGMRSLGQLTFTASGVSGEVIGSMSLLANTNGEIVETNATGLTVNTTNAVLVTLGYRWTKANNSNLITIVTAFIRRIM